MMTDSEFEILPWGFEGEYASEMRCVKPRRIPTWTADKYKPGLACDLCLRRRQRAHNITYQWERLIDKLRERSDDHQTKCDLA